MICVKRGDGGGGGGEAALRTYKVSGRREEIWEPFVGWRGASVQIAAPGSRGAPLLRRTCRAPGQVPPRSTAVPLGWAPHPAALASVRPAPPDAAGLFPSPRTHGRRLPARTAVITHTLQPALCALPRYPLAPGPRQAEGGQPKAEGSGAADQAASPTAACCECLNPEPGARQGRKKVQCFSILKILMLAPRN